VPAKLIEAIREGSMEERDYYEVLQLHPSADHAMVAQAYWYLARKYKAAADRNACTERALVELNQSFDVLGSPESRAEYDRRRGQMRNGTLSTTAESGATKRVSIEVSFWCLPAWQGVLAATAAIALAVIALAAGAEPVVTLLIAAVAVGASLITLPSHFAASREALGLPLRRHWKRDLRVVQRCDLRVPARRTWRDSGK
jgi:curved DNA-binding protein CbpA